MGDSIYAGSTATLTQQVAPAATTTSLTSDGNPASSGQAVTFTVTVAALDTLSATPGGTVDFYDGTMYLGTGTLSLVDGQMQATFTTSALGLGSHAIVALYSGDSTFADSGASMDETITS